MAVPFTPFPIFAPYEHWKPVGATDVPENLAVRRRLDDVDPACQAYLSILYCSHFLEYSSHRWAPAWAKSLYTQTCRFLEQMLNWSFNAGISLLAWETPHFLQFLEFLCHPPISWCSTASHAKYGGTAVQTFKTRPINERWKLFYRHIDSAGAAKPTRRDMQRCAKIVRDFFDFYISDTTPETITDKRSANFSDSGSSAGSVGKAQTTARNTAKNDVTNSHSGNTSTSQLRVNCAQAAPTGFFKTLAQSRPLLTHEPHELDWAFQQLMDGVVPILRSEQILFYMAIARFSRIKISHVHSLSQFQRNSDSGWTFENGLPSGAVMELTPEFSAHLERYLGWYSIDLFEPVPVLPAFPSNDGSISYAPDTLESHLKQFRKRLASAASVCADLAIARAETNFAGMTFTTIRRSTIFTWKTYGAEFVAQRRREWVKHSR